jgi:CPA1 family monovalent cation:H+ antiporter
LLEAESLVNDGSGLVALRFTLAMVLTGASPSIASGFGTLFYLISMAIVIGLIVAFVVHWLQRRIVDPPIEITISLVTPYIAYLAAENAHCSGVLATLACGIYIGRRSSGFYSPRARIDASAVWHTIDFILNGIVFLILGLQLPVILSEIRGTSKIKLIITGALFSLMVILLRMLWVFPGAWLSMRFRRAVTRKTDEEYSPRSIFLVGWAGMRGVLALAAALSLPERLDNGAPFPQRSMILFLTFCVIFATLVLQGLSMPALIRRLGLAGVSSSGYEEAWARRQMIYAALEALSRLRGDADTNQHASYTQLEEYYRRRLQLLKLTMPGEAEPAAQQAEQYRSIAQELRDVERSVAMALRDQNKIHDEVLRTLEHELDLVDARFAQPGA